MRLIDRTPKVDRRSFLASTGAAALVVTSTSVLCPTESWGVEAQNLKPEAVRTLITMSRDIYPHDRLADRFYAVAVKGMDGKATEGAPLKATLEDGVAKLDEAVRRVLEVGAPVLVYVSCHPATFADNAARFVEGGYRLEYVQPVDMFPQTPHVEAVARFTRATA